MNGISIDEIEKRARPGQHAYSYSGFLGPTESFKEVLKADWETVYSMGTTHMELAKHIKAIWKEAFGRGYGRSYYIIHSGNLQGYDIRYRDRIAFKPAIVSFLVTIIASAVLTPWALLGFIPTALLTILVITNKQILYVNPVSTKGMQWDILSPNGWNEHMEVTNILNGKSFTIGRGVMDYIEKYGFYEGGGDQNKYRVDPKRLVIILTGAKE